MKFIEFPNLCLFFMKPWKRRTIYEILIIIPALDYYPHSNNTRSWRPCKKIIPRGLQWGNTVLGDNTASVLTKNAILYGKLNLYFKVIVWKMHLSMQKKNNNKSHTSHRCILIMFFWFGERREFLFNFGCIGFMITVFP